jgi:general secretion pathway protein I
VLVAFTIAAFLLVAILRVMTNGLDAAKRSETFTRAVILAESMLDTIGVVAPLNDGDETDLRDGPFIIHAVVRHFEDAAPSGIGQYVTLYQISATVSWRDGRRQETVALQTLRLGRVH